MRFILLRAFVVSCCISSALSAAEIRDGLWNGKPWDSKKLMAGVEKGDPAACAEWAYSCFIGTLASGYDEVAIFDQSKKAADAGDPLGMSMLARCYAKGINCHWDGNKTLRLAKAASEAGHPLGMKELSNCHFFEYGTSRNDEKGQLWLKRSVEGGCIVGRFNTSVLLAGGEFLPKDEEKSIAISLEALGKPGCELFATRVATMALTPGQREHVTAAQAEMAGKIVRELAANRQPDALSRIGWSRVWNHDVDGGLPLIVEAANLGCSAAINNLLVMANGGLELEGHWVPVVADIFSMGEIALRALKRGHRTRDTCYYAGWYMTMPDRPGGADLAGAEPLLRQSLKWGAEQVFQHLGTIYLTLPEKLDVERGVACLTYDLVKYENLKSAQWLGWYLVEGIPEVRDPVRGYAACDYAVKNPMAPVWAEAARGWRKTAWERCTPEQRKEAEELVRENYPAAEKFQQEAKKVLRRHGDLPADE